MRSLIAVSSLLSTLCLATFIGCSDKDDGDPLDPNPSSGGSGSNTGGSTGSGGDGNVTGGSTGTGTGGGGEETLPPCETLVGLNQMECGQQTAGAVVKRPNIMLVIDKSGSMTDTPTGFGTNKWEALKTALRAALNEVKDQVSFGMELFPRADCTTGCCVDGTDTIDVTVKPGATSVPEILTFLDNSAPAGGTPAAAGLARAYEYFTTGPGKDLAGERYVLLAADGAPNCDSSLSCPIETCTANMDQDSRCEGRNCCEPQGQGGHICLDDQGTLTQIQALAAAGIPTYVVGIPGTEAYADYLDTFATAGTVPNTAGGRKFYEVTAEGGVEGLTAVFRTITTQLIRSCEIELKEQPPDPTQVNVAINCDVVAKGTTEAPNWELGATSITLIGSKCEWLQQNGAMRVDVIFGCPTVDVR